MEKLSIKGMIESILSDITDNNPIDSYVLKIQMIIRSLKNEQLSSWVKKELDGYENDDTLPPHRILKTRIIANLIIDNGIKGVKITNHEIPLYTLPEDDATKMSTIHIKDSIISLSKIISSREKGQIAYSITEYEKYLLSTIYEYSTILSAYKSITKADFEFIIYKFKTILLDLFMELNETIFNDEIDFDIMTKRKEVDKIVNQTINAGVYNQGDMTISDSTVIGGQSNEVHINTQTKNEIENILNQIEALSNEIDEDRTDIADTILSIREELENKMPRPRFLKTAFNSFKAIGTGVFANQITPFVNSAIELINKMQ